MARIPYPDPAQTPERVREALARLPQLNIFRMLAHAETAFRPFLRFGGSVLTELALDPRLRELAILQVARQAEARYEWIQHAAIARELGVTSEQIAAVEQMEIATAACLSELERAVLQFASEVVAGPRVSDETFAAVSGRLSPRRVPDARARDDDAGARDRRCRRQPGLRLLAPCRALTSRPAGCRRPAYRVSH